MHAVLAWWWIVGGVLFVSRAVTACSRSLPSGHAAGTNLQVAEFAPTGQMAVTGRPGRGGSR